MILYDDATAGDIIVLIVLIPAVCVILAVVGVVVWMIRR